MTLEPIETKKLVIFGLGDFAEIAYEYFKKDSEFEVVAFTVEANYMNLQEKFGLPIYAFESIEKILNPKDHYFFCALLYNNMNDLRTNFLDQAIAKGYTPASYISSKAFVWENVEIGEHCFIFENNTLQPFSKIGRNCVFWSGNHIGHHAQIGENCFISSHVVISGAVSIGRNTFIGVNSTITNSIEIGERSWISLGTVVSKNLSANSLVLPESSKVVELDEKLLVAKLNKISTARFK